ncbi:MAG: VOC family protein, partial [Nocardioidaceae bacterium]
FVNLAVEDLDRAVRFFTELGFRFDPRFTDETATCMIVSDEAYVMLLVEDFYRTFTTKDVVDADSGNEVILCLSADSRAEVDDLVRRALAGGGKPSNDPLQDGPMYGWSFQDVDGHLWELMYLDPAAYAEQSG